MGRTAGDSRTRWLGNRRRLAVVILLAQVLFGPVTVLVRPGQAQDGPAQNGRAQHGRAQDENADRPAERTPASRPERGGRSAAPSEAGADSEAPGEAREADAEAEPEDAVEQARALYTRGQARFSAGAYAEAEEAFRQAYEKAPNPVVQKAIAAAQERQGNIVGAIETLRRYLESAPPAEEQERVRARMAALRQTPGSLNITSQPPNARVRLDGQEASGTTPLSLSIAPGEHRVEVVLEGHLRQERSVEVVPGGRTQIEVALEPTPDERFGSGEDEIARSEEPSRPPDDTDGAEGPSTEVWLTAGLAGGTLIAGTVFGFLALSELSNYDAQPSAAVADRGEAFAIAADVGFALAGTLALTSIVLYLVQGSESNGDEARGRRPLLSAGIDPRGGIGMTGQIGF